MDRCLTAVPSDKVIRLLHDHRANKKPVVILSREAPPSAMRSGLVS